MANQLGIFFVAFLFISLLAYCFIDDASFARVRRAVTIETDCDDLPTLESERVIHQMYETEPNEMPTYYRQTWLHLHQTWTYILWNEESNLLLIRCRLPEFRTKYEELPTLLQREFIKFAYLYVYGGLYVNLEYVALQSHEKLFRSAMENDHSLMLTNYFTPGIAWALAPRRSHILWLTAMKAYDETKTAEILMKYYIHGTFKDVGKLEAGVYKDILVVDHSILSPQITPDDLACLGVDKQSIEWWFSEFFNSPCYFFLRQRGIFAFLPTEISQEGDSDSSENEVEISREVSTEQKVDPKTREVTLHGGYKLLITQKPSHDPTKSSSEARPTLAPSSMAERLEKLRDIVKERISAATETDSATQPASVTEMPLQDPPTSLTEAEVNVGLSRIPSVAPTTMKERLERLRELVKQKIQASPTDSPKASALGIDTVKYESFEQNTDSECASLPKIPAVGFRSKIIHQTCFTTNSTKWPSQWPYFYEQWDSLHPGWEHILWTDEMNEKLIKCYFPEYLPKFERIAVKVKQADFIRHAYMLVYGGVYADMDYLPLQNHDWFYEKMDSERVGALLSNEKSHGVALEWSMSRSGHPMWRRCMDMCDPRAGRDPVETTGPEFVKRCFLDYTGVRSTSEKPKAGRYHDVYLLEADYVSAIHWWTPKGNPCWGVKFQPLDYWHTNFTSSPCRQWLREHNSFAWTIYSTSWNPTPPPKFLEKTRRRLLEDFWDWIGDLIGDNPHRSPF